MKESYLCCQFLSYVLGTLGCCPCCYIRFHIFIYDTLLVRIRIYQHNKPNSFRSDT
jgi:hypothetical protein